jgi:hypothetical protein
VGVERSEHVGLDVRGFNYGEVLESLLDEHTINIPNYSIESMNFDPDERTVIWAKDGEDSLVDLSIIDLRCSYSESGANHQLMWVFVTDGVNTSVTAPALPAEISDWFDFPIVSESEGHYYYLNGGEVYIGVESGDYADANGYNELLEYIQENVTDYASGPDFSAFYMKPEPPGYGG